MRPFEAHHPLAVTAYFLAVTSVAMFSLEPLTLGLSLAGALGLFLRRNGLREGRSHFYTLLLFIGAALLNPLFSHNGVTVLFVMNHNPVTLEATLYGLAAAGMIVATLYWFRSFSQIMTSDRLLCLFGALSPRLALILSMALRYVPLFTRQWRKTQQSQRALGLYQEDSIVDSLWGRLRVLSIMVTWALENGVITADSMEARGYGIGRRTHFARFRFTWRDGLLTSASLLLCGVSFWAVYARQFVFYPAISAAAMTVPVALGHAAYALLALLPLMIDGEEALRWRCLQSGI